MFRKAAFLLLSLAVLFTAQLVVTSGSASAANSAANLDQCANGPASSPVPCTGSAWQNGNLNGNQAHYSEGESVPYRLKLTEIATGSQVHAVKIEWDTTKGGKHALDYLTSYNRTEASADPCSVAGFPCNGPTTTFPIPADPNVTAEGVSQAAGVLTLFGGTITGVGSYTRTGLYSGDSSTSITVYFTAASDNLVLAWGGHIAERKDWGFEMSAVAISGSPYHMRLLDLNGSGGNQDRSLSSDAVTYPGSITVIKDALPEGSAQFSFSASPAPLGPFNLIDDGSPSDRMSFTGITGFTTYTLTESPAAPYVLTGIACAVTSANGGSRSISGSTATVSLKEGENVTCTFSNRAPALDLEKSVSQATYDAPGQTITYTYTVTNSGYISLAGPFSVADDKLGTINPCGSGPLAPGAFTSCSASYSVTQADIDVGSVTNVATASGNGVISNEATATVTAIQRPALDLVKSADRADYSAVGQVITYSYVITNAGNVTLSGPFSINDNRLSTFACASVSLAPGASTSCNATYVVQQADLDAGSITNVAFASGNGVVSPEDTVTVDADQHPAIALKKEPSPAQYSAAGQVVGYVFTITNTGNVTLQGPFTLIDDKLGTISPCGAGSLAPGDSTSCSGSHTVTQADVDAGSITNIASASADRVTSNQATATVTAIQSPTLGIDKLADPVTFSAAGQVISYTFVVTNTGNVTLSGPLMVSDNPLGPVACGAGPLAPAATSTCSVLYTVTQADIDSGSITNVAFATAVFKNVVVKSANDTVTIDAVQVRTLGLTKSANPSTYSAVGQVITYTFVVQNTGNVTLSGPFTVSDDKLGAFACGAGPLAPGASTSCAKTYAVTQADLNAGSITNTATASGNGVTSAPASATVTTIQNPALSLQKSASPATYAAAGDVITYTFVIKNTGNVTIDGPLTVDDNRLGAIACATGPLAPGAPATCTATYLVQQSDLTAGSITNTATAAGFFKGSAVTSGPASATVNASAATGQLTPTGTTCLDFAGGTAQTQSEILYGVKSGKINNVAPGVFFYYTEVTAPASIFTVQVIQTDTSPAFKSMSVQQNTLYSQNCATSKIGSFRTTTSSDSLTTTATIKGAVPGQTYYIGIKYNPGAIVGTLVGNQSPTVPYTFVTKVNGVLVPASSATLQVKPKVATTTASTTSISAGVSSSSSNPATPAPAPTATATPLPTATPVPATKTPTPGSTATSLATATATPATAPAPAATATPVLASTPVPATPVAQAASARAQMTSSSASCQDFSSGRAATLSEVTYELRSGKISKLSPTSFAYWAMVVAPASSFTLEVVQTDASAAFAGIGVQQAQMLNSACRSVKLGTVKTAASASAVTTTFAVSGAVPGQAYYVNIKYTPGTLVGTVAANRPVVAYDFAAKLNSSPAAGGSAPLNLRPK